MKVTTMMASFSSTPRVITANLHHSIAATAQIRRWLEGQPTTITLIQEPWIDKGRIRGFSNTGGKLIYSTNHDNPRTCILTSNNLNVQPLTEFCCRDLCAIRLTLPQPACCKEVVLASVYMHEQNDTPPQELRSLVNHCEQAGLELIIGTDSNAHHPLWGMDRSNDRGKALVEYLFTTNLNLINVGSEATYVTKRTRTIIDLTLATKKATELIKGWHVSREDSCSDHRWILFDLDVSIPHTTPRRYPRKTDKVKFKDALKRRLEETESTSELREPQHIEEQVTCLNNSIIDSFHTACPLSSPKTTSIEGQPWWGPELERLRHKLRRCLNRAMNTCTDKDWDKYQATKVRYSKRLRFRSAKSWKRYSTGIETLNHANRVRKVLADQPASDLGSLKKPDGTYTSSKEESQNLLLVTHFPGSEVLTTIKWQDEEYNSDNAHWQIAERVITEDKLRWAISSFQPFKSAGPDGIFPALLQWGSELILGRLVRIMRACLALGYIPKAWRETNVIFIPKPGRSDYTNPKSFRPISLTSFLLKTMERLVERDLRDGALKDIPLHRNQHAYCQGKSTESALHAVVTRIEEALREKIICLGTFIDIEGAFDKTHYSSIGEALMHHGADPSLVGWIKSMLGKRVVRLAGETKAAAVVRGCPQGGVLSPLLWNLVINDLITKLNASNFYTIGYADDLAILVTGRTAGTACDLTRSALRIVERWCKDHDLSANPTKTELVMFTNKRVLGNFKLPKLFKTELQLATEVKYLGLILDSKLNWSNHIDKRIEKASIIFWQCRRMIGKRWGLKPKIILWLYKTVIRPLICYGAAVWWPRTKLVTAVNKLASFQRLACVAATGCIKTTPTAALEVMLNITPLHLHIQEEAAVAAVRLRSLKLWKNSKVPHTAILGRVHERFPILLAGNDRIPKRFVFDKKYKIQLHESDDYEGLNLKELRIFTDGSKTDDGTGTGVFSEDLCINIAQPLGDHNSVFQAECMGIILAAQAIMERKVKDFPIRILTDSMAVLLALNRYEIGSGLIYECHLRLTEVGSLNPLTLQWIKGHSNSRGNDAADELARRGSSMKAVGPEPIIPIPYGKARSLIADYTQRLHAEAWTSQDGCRQAKEALPSINGRITKSLLHLSKLQLRKVTAALTGHGSFNKHLFVLGVTDSPLCRACMEVEETAAHVILECIGVSQHRANHLGTPRCLSEVAGNVRSLLAFLEELGWLE